MYRETTDRVARERKLERRTEELEELTTRLETQYRYLFEEAPIMAVVTRNRGGVPVVEDCDQLFAETLGYDRGEIIGRELTELYTAASSVELLDGGGYERALDREFQREKRELVVMGRSSIPPCELFHERTRPTKPLGLSPCISI